MWIRTNLTRNFTSLLWASFSKHGKADCYDYDRFLCCACFSLRSSGPTARTPRWELRFSAGEDTHGWPGTHCPGAMQASPPSEAGERSDCFTDDTIDSAVHIRPAGINYHFKAVLSWKKSCELISFEEFSHFLGAEYRNAAMHSEDHSVTKRSLA